MTMYIYFSFFLNSFQKLNENLPLTLHLFEDNMKQKLFVVLVCFDHQLQIL